MARERTNLLPPTTIEFNAAERIRDKGAQRLKEQNNYNMVSGTSNTQDPLILLS